MAYNNFPSSNSGLGMPTAGYASRGKANGLKRLSVASPPKVGPINEDEVDNGSTPSRGSRLNMLAGLRTAPRTPSGPTSAPFTQTQHNVGGLAPSNYAARQNNGARMGVPHTAIGSTFPTATHQLSMNPGQQFYTLPDQVMTPPAIQIDNEDQLDPVVMAQISAQQQFFQLRAKALQAQSQQFAVSQQFRAFWHNLEHPESPITPQLALYQDQIYTDVAPIPYEVPGQPGLFVVWDPRTSQYYCVVDHSASELANSPPPPTPNQTAPVTNLFVGHVPTYLPVPPLTDTMNPSGRRSITPPKSSPSPPGSNVAPLPPKSANAWRPDHRNKVSSLTLSNIGVDTPPKSARMPATPTTGGFGPGGGRVGEHPDREPRNPPEFEELKAKPTTKNEGSKNFAVRTRRKALGSLRRAGFERRVVRDSGSAGSMTPVSETELTFSVPSSDNDSDSIGSGSASLSGEPSPGFPPPGMSRSLAIGSERKASKGSNQLSPPSEFGELSLADETHKQLPGQRRAPLLGLVGAAEKRRSGMY